MAKRCSDLDKLLDKAEEVGGINNFEFTDIIQKICNILDIGQLFIISHSVESALNNVDVVLLSDNQEYKDQFERR